MKIKIPESFKEVDIEDLTSDDLALLFSAQVEISKVNVNVFEQVKSLQSQETIEFFGISVKCAENEPTRTATENTDSTETD